MLLVLLGSCPALLSYTAPGGVAEAPRLESMSAAKAAEVRWWRLQRLKLLALNDRLETCMVGVAGVGAGLWAVFRDCRKVVFQTGPVDRHRVVYAGEQGTGLCWGPYGGCAGDGEDLRLQCMPEAPPVEVPACINSPSFQQRNEAGGCICQCCPSAPVCQLLQVLSGMPRALLFCLLLCTAGTQAQQL